MPVAGDEHNFWVKLKSPFAFYNPNKILFEHIRNHDSGQTPIFRKRHSKTQDRNLFARTVIHLSRSQRYLVVACAVNEQKIECG